MPAAVFSSPEEAAAAFALGPVRFRCGVCKKVHVSSGRGWARCAALLCRRRPYAELLRAGVPAEPLGEVFGKNPYYFPVVRSAVVPPWESASKILTAKAVVKKMSPALLAVPDPGAALDSALRAERDCILRSFPSFREELEAYREFLAWLKSPGPVFGVSSVSEFELRGRYVQDHEHRPLFASSDWRFYSWDWVRCMASAAGLRHSAFDLVRYRYSGGALRAVLYLAKTGEVSLSFGPGGLL